MISFISDSKGFNYHQTAARIVIAAVFTLTQGAQARPELAMAQHLPQIIGYPRQSVIVVTNEGSEASPILKMRRPGIIPLDSAGHLIWFDNEDWRAAKISGHDQILLSEDMLGVGTSSRIKFTGCVPENGIQVKQLAPAGPPKFAWLASCETDVLRRLPVVPPQVRVDMHAGVLESKNYRYQFKTKNHMLFDLIQFQGPTDHPGWRPFASDSDLLIRADVRNFFTLQFDSSDIESQMRATRIEEFGALATIQFYLKILFFKITLDLDTDASFFGSSARIPMVLNVPNNAEKRLNPKSGILYSFNLDNGVHAEPTPKMPRLDLDADQRIGGIDGFCVGNICRYSIRFIRSDEESSSEFSMQLAIPKNLVEHGMFPRYVDDVGAVNKDMGWRFSKLRLERRRHGIYFEVSNLPAGEHPWELWLGLKP